MPDAPKTHYHLSIMLGHKIIYILRTPTHTKNSTPRTLIGHNDDNYDDDELFLWSGLTRTPIRH